jgi:hypothetical protein
VRVLHQRDDAERNGAHLQVRELMSFIQTPDPRGYERSRGGILLRKHRPIEPCWPGYEPLIRIKRIAAITLSGGPTESGAESSGVGTISLGGVDTGDGIVCCALWDGGTAAISNVTCSGESNLTLLSTSGPNTNISSTVMLIAYLPSCAAGGTKTIAVNLDTSAGGSLAAFAMAVTGHDTSTFYDAGTDSYATGNSAAPSVPVTTSVPNCMIVGITNNGSGGGAATAGSGVAGITIITVTDRHWNDDGLYVLDAGAAGAKTFDASIPSAQWGIKAAAFKPAGAGGTGAQARRRRLRLTGIGPNA